MVYTLCRDEYSRTQVISVKPLHINTSNNNQTPATSHPVAPEARAPDRASRPYANPLSLPSTISSLTVLQKHLSPLLHEVSPHAPESSHTWLLPVLRARLKHHLLRGAFSNLTG